MRQHGIDRCHELAALGIQGSLGVDHASAQAREGLAHRCVEATGLDVTLQRARHRAVGRVARIAEALAHGRLDQLQRLRLIELELYAQEI
jgi:hypothetical protein